MMRSHRLVALAVLAPFLWLQAVACNARGPVLPPEPRPPVVKPVEPPTPPVTSRVVTEAEFLAFENGAALASIRAKFGEPVRVVRLAEEGVDVYVYRARTPEDPTKTAEFWIKDGVLVNSVLF